MHFINRLEFKFGRYAIPGITRWIVLLNAVTYVILSQQRSLTGLLLLDADLVMQGQLWRLFTYLFIPPSLDPIWIVFALYFFYLMGEGLEHEWGAFRLNLYYLVGMIGTTVVAFFFEPGAVSNGYLNTSIFLAFATIYPDYIIYLFFILPVKVKWLGWLSGVVLAFRFLSEPLAAKCAILISVANYLLFFGKTIRDYLMMQQRTHQSRRRLREFQKTDVATFHQCVTCSRTEVSNPDLTFRVAADGNEYCIEHLPLKKIVSSTIKDGAS